MRSIPPDLGWKLLAGVAALVLAVTIIRKVAQMNRLLLGVAVFIGVSAVGLNWVYERNEPSWATPVVRLLAAFLPSKVRV